jgi:hypothetical protein
VSDLPAEIDYRPPEEAKQVEEQPLTCRSSGEARLWRPTPAPGRGTRRGAAAQVPC